MLGHNDIRLTLNTYSHITPDRQDTVVLTMNSALNRSQFPGHLTALAHARVNFPANPVLFDARPAGFEPATGGLEVRGDRFQHVPVRCRTRLPKTNSLVRRCRMFRVVASG